MGTLYLVATPIGNLEDLTLRATRILREVDLVLAEDTRRTGILLRHLGATTPMLSLHQHNEGARSAELLERLIGGGTMALVSDAGTPLVSDPGETLVRRAIAAGVGVVPIPGPSAVLHALVGSGFPAIPFTFRGFPPRKGREREEFLERIGEAPETTVLFESPERTGVLLRELAERCGAEREGVVARELTKVHEEFRRGTLGELANYYADASPRGEVTIVLAGGTGVEPSAGVDREAALALARVLLAEGESPSRTAREVARRLRLTRNMAYSLVQEMDLSQPPES